MATDAQGNNLNAVAVPITGFLAVAPVVAANVIAPAEGGAQDLEVPAAYRKIGLIKQDGGFEQADEASGDAIEFWQQGYKKGSGTANSTVTVGAAQTDPIVREVSTGRTPDANGHIYVNAAGSDLQYIVLTEEIYKRDDGSFFAERQNYVARVQSVERDKSERGSVRGRNIVFERIESDLFGGAHYSEWVIDLEESSGD